uniref:non-specific serine/threonine protein kinase n=1 Tax=Glycine max TaxID=3847 RepID=A0A0R0IG81_SOYBN
MNPKQLLLLFFSLFLTITFSLNERFEACDAKTCGNGQNISYPFYIQGKQKPFCGQPGFELTCSHKGFPILTLMYTPYTIHQIFYDNQSLRVSNPVFSQPNLSSCIAPTQNLTVGRYRFRVAPNQRELFVLYGCDSAALQKTVPERRIWCSAAGNETTSVVGLDKGDRDLVSARESCKGGAVNATVDDLKGGVREALQRGFLLLWNATSCSECKSSGGRCGFDIDPRVYAFRCYCPDRPHAVKCTNTGLSVVILCMLMIGLLLHCKRKHSSSSGQFQTRNTFSIPSSPNAEVESGSVYFGVPLFSYKELAEATNRFDLNKQIGDGGFGTVYNGKLKDGREVAVKHLYNHNYRRVEQFMNEIQILTRLRHRNLVSLYGCTSRQSRELLLVYEYIPNGTVASHLHGELAKPGLLTWSLRIKIALETASALSYLHASKIIHRDVKTNNILLDNSFCVKVADFGLSRLFPNDMTHVSTAPQGTPGYVDPEYHQCYQLTSKSDVYSFGVVLIELISSMPAVDMNRHKDEINLSNLAIKKIQERALSELVDPYLGFDSDKEVKRMIVEVAELAFQCLQQDRELRPPMDEVLEVLKRIESGKDELKHLEEAVHGSGSGVSHNVTTSSLDEAGLLKNRKPPSSPISVTDSWESKSTTPNASS